ncbi:TPA: hypothetical protein DDW69_03730 [candidate division CPR2 bacterium]|uniref:Putative gluconeogenesis factor n=1 Tax=candidate division CPR2 bacterium GW2011_GWC1_41_48 TaxID=1618344 RepID=A0A0G0W7K9_UNCC2|nr:MAG: hypothetical protein UT47_C0003G0060 [candidate division CPR2 bacterium GW2011_GWC2_39_35]KKR28833.1 MAG: hypothetical protein UT59_C0018G0012 [candidate division CPR2 bacterium GW2011_GWD1_39_7]KKR29344.1 MAG: hypothetical protein UT60_C0003G0021 [candidate division CPR2 bacterium GW2011_GWD2_39_7]KKS08999.1 MAG: hypothetical protein UU65_C0003G0054 [candidate division CPR2 bacterium GW2011_GWC1_41_48]OGB61442.1 MAG: hypothetical protein A2Y27_03780 [candidate division CPR2 bacterium G
MKKVVVIGGGTGNFTILSGLREYPLDITAVVAMADDGGSTAALRDEFGILPPGDVRQCLVALSEESELLRKLFNYRFDRGVFFGHTFGNLFITALERVTGNFEKAVEEASDILKVKGKVLPVTTDDVRLCCKLDNRRIVKGEHKLDEFDFRKYKKREFYLEPEGKINPKVKKAILEADLVVLSPGTLSTSLLANLVVKGFPEALKKTKAKFIYISNLVNKPEENEDWCLEDYLEELKKYSGRGFDLVLFNVTEPSTEVKKRYLAHKETPVKMKNDNLENVIRLDLISNQIAAKSRADMIKRSFIRHDSDKIAAAIMEVLDRDQNSRSILNAQGKLSKK